MVPEDEDAIWHMLSVLGTFWMELWQKFGMEHETTPHQWVDNELLEGDDDACEQAWSEAVTALENSKKCCLQWVAQGWKKYISTMEPSQRGSVLRTCYFHFTTSKNKESNLKEERMHRFQKSAAGGFDMAATSFRRQVVEVLCGEVARTYEENGGRPLARCEAGMVKDFKAATSAIGTDPRPNQVGNPIIKFVGEIVAKIQVASKKKKEG